MAEKQPVNNNNLIMAAGLLAGVVSYLNWESFPMAMAATLVTAVLIHLWRSQKAAPTAVRMNHVTVGVLRWVRQWFGPKEEVVKLNMYDIALGHDMADGRWVVQNLKHLKSMAIWGVNGSGKTSFIHSLVHFIISYYTPEQIMLTFSDLKDGVDFYIYRRLPHLFCPIATTVEDTERMIALLEEEMKQRARQFRVVANSGSATRLCNDIDRYHALRTEYGREDLPVLPLVLAVFDEISTFTRKATTLDRIILLAEKGRAYGIFLICATQYPKVESIPSNLREQCPTRFVGRMSPRAYKVADVYKDDWDNVNLKTRQFFASLGTAGADYIVLQGQLVPYEELEAVANDVSAGSDEPVWPESAAVAHAQSGQLKWSGSDDDKIAMLRTWFQQFDERPTIDDWTRDIGAAPRTYHNWVPQQWEIYQGQ